jgi:hypothetical protein
MPMAPFSGPEWFAAIRAAPPVKEGHYTVLSSQGVLPEVGKALTDDGYLKPCLKDCTF